MTRRFLQTKFWTSFKENHGWKAYYFKYDENNGCLSPVDSSTTDQNFLSVLVRTFSVKIKKISIAYIPMAPEFSGTTEEYAKKINLLALELKKYIPSNTICVRFDPPVDFEEISEVNAFIKDIKSISSKNKLIVKRSSVAVQPPDTTVLDLTKSEEEILAGMKNKWRYNVRLAAKKGVEVIKTDFSKPDFLPLFEEFFKLFEITSKRDGVNFHSKEYYLDLLERSSSTANNTENIKVQLYIAKHESDYLAGIITLFFQGEAVYLYGASGNIKRNLMAAYLLQWTAIKDAKEYGCPSYDFYGMPPTDDENHPMHGLYLFKTGFGGKIIHRPGSYDAVLRSGDYKLYTFAENCRAWFYKKVIKKLAGR